MLLPQQTSTGLVASSSINPSDEIPIGPQIFPYGNPSIARSNIEPYIATDYRTNGTNNFENLYPTNNYRKNSISSKNQSKDAFQAIGYGTTQTPNYDSNSYKTIEFEKKEHNLINPNISTITNGYQLVTSYRPVSTTTYTPIVKTSYVPVTITTVDGVEINSSNSFFENSQISPNTVPLPAPVQVSDIPIPKPKPIPQASLVPFIYVPQPHSHYVSNYPIYDEESRRIRSYISTNPNHYENLVFDGNYFTSSYNPNGFVSTRTTNLGRNNSLNIGLNRSFNGFNTSNLSKVNTGLNTSFKGIKNGFNKYNSGFNSKLNTFNSNNGELSGLSKRLANNVNSGINNLGNNVSNEVNNFRNKVSNINNELNGSNNFTDNIRTKFN